MYNLNNMVVISCADKMLCDSMKLFFENRKKAAVNCVYADSYKIYYMIKNQRPNYVVIDSSVVNANMIENLKNIDNYDKISYIINLTSKYEMINKSINELNIKGFIYPPFDVDNFERLFDEISKEEEERNIRLESIKGENLDHALEMRITNILCSMGMPANIRGYRFLREAIIIVTKYILDPNFPSTDILFTKNIYPQIAKKFNTTLASVERNSRHAINIIWERGNISAVNIFFSNYAFNSGIRPTNAEFIVKIADLLSLEINHEKFKYI